MRRAAAPGTNATAFDEAFQIMSHGGDASFLTFLWMELPGATRGSDARHT
jgi:hypothetical protein